MAPPIYAKPSFSVGSVFVTQTHLPGGEEIPVAERQTYHCPHGQNIEWSAKLNIENFRGGTGAMPLVAAIKDAEITGSLEAPILAQMMGAILGGTTTAGLMKAFTPSAPTQTDDAGANHNIDISSILPDGATFAGDLGATSETGVPLVRVADATTAGTYSVGAGGNYKFGASGKYFVFAAYSLTQAGAKVVEIDPIQTGAPPRFILRYVTGPLGKSSSYVEFDAVVFNGHKSGSKGGAFSSPSMDFTVMVSDTNTIGRIYMGQG